MTRAPQVRRVETYPQPIPVDAPTPARVEDRAHADHRGAEGVPLAGRDLERQPRPVEVAPGLARGSVEEARDGIRDALGPDVHPRAAMGAHMDDHGMRPEPRGRDELVGHPLDAPGMHRRVRRREVDQI